MRFLSLYLRRRWKTAAVFALFVLLFALSFALYRLPLAAVLYPALLCLGLGLVFALLNILHVRRRCRALDLLLGAPEEPESFPRAESPEEVGYQELVRGLYRERRELAARTDERFSGMVDYYTVWAHQIKTPIAAMRLTLQNEDSPLSRRLTGELFRVEQYVEMVLTYLRLDADSTDYLIREYDLDAIIRGELRKYRNEFIDRHLRLEYEPAQARVLTDEKWLSFIIGQLLSNALKYTLAGSIAIRLEPPLTLCIADTGIGIAPEDLPRIFEKGYTGGNGRTDKSASGIGLYLCRRVCRNLGHGISAESVPGRGTTVRLDLSRRHLEAE